LRGHMIEKFARRRSVEARFKSRIEKAF